MIDVIGPLYAAPDEAETRARKLRGFHVNVTPDVLETHPELQSRVVTPETMLRVWAGDDPASPASTVALRFLNEASARSTLGDLWPEGD